VGRQTLYEHNKKHSDDAPVVVVKPTALSDNGNEAADIQASDHPLGRVKHM
jgi:hypothetical protein